MNFFHSLFQKEISFHIFKSDIYTWIIMILGFQQQLQFVDYITRWVRSIEWLSQRSELYVIVSYLGGNRYKLWNERRTFANELTYWSIGIIDEIDGYFTIARTYITIICLYPTIQLRSIILYFIIKYSSLCIHVR